MFVGFQKVVGGRNYTRYFHHWQNAKNAMDKETKEAVERFGWKITKKGDYFIPEKGIYEYFVHGTTNEGEPFSFALVEFCFEDEL